jgi:RNA polymerase sigma-32 factor
VEREETEEDTSSRLKAAVASLDARSRDILVRRFLAEDKATLHELAAQYNVSAERVRQIEANALKKLRNLLGEGTL